MSPPILPADPLAAAPPYRPRRALLRGSLIAGAVGTAAIVLGFIVDHRATCFGYLAGYVSVLSTVLGALVFLLACNAIGAVWPVAIRRLLETVVMTLPLFAVGFIPVLLCMKHLYPWVSPADIANPLARELVEKKLGWLNPGFFGARAGFYLLVWIGAALALRLFSLRQDAARAPTLEADRQAAHTRTFSALALPPIALTMTFAAFDWLMSLMPAWYSTMYGVYWFAGGFVSAFAAITVLLFLSDGAGLLKPTRGHYYALGRLLLSFTIFWGYIAFFQYFLIWIANKPTEVPWYLLRSRGGWAPVSVILALAHFAVPFFALLPYEVKQRPRFLVAASLWILIAHHLDSVWLVAPQLTDTAVAPVRAALWSLAPLLALGGFGLALGAFLLRGHPFTPTGDVRLARALAYEAK
jgi:hypothetical protein